MSGPPIRLLVDVNEVQAALKINPVNICDCPQLLGTVAPLRLQHAPSAQTMSTCAGNGAVSFLVGRMRT
jgi:hypothetical protein